jgi:Domain of unknown function (DUF4440)
VKTGNSGRTLLAGVVWLAAAVGGAGGFLVTGCLLTFGRSHGDNANPMATVQRLFDAMSAHDADAARALFTPEATLLTVRANGSTAVVPHEKWLEHLGGSKDAWLERMWNAKVLEHGSIAVVWAEYDFHLNGKFSHCGIDSVSLLKTTAGWKISGISFTSETSGCPPSPLGPPAK